jgi:hypothetical protein
LAGPYWPVQTGCDQNRIWPVQERGLSNNEISNSRPVAAQQEWLIAVAQAPEGQGLTGKPHLPRCVARLLSPVQGSVPTSRLSVRAPCEGPAGTRSAPRRQSRPSGPPTPAPGRVRSSPRHREWSGRRRLRGDCECTPRLAPALNGRPPRGAACVPFRPSRRDRHPPRAATGPGWRSGRRPRPRDAAGSSHPHGGHADRPPPEAGPR